MEKKRNWSFEEIVDLGWKVEFGTCPRLFNADSKKVRTISEGNAWIESKLKEFKKGPKAFLAEMKKTIFKDIEEIEKDVEEGNDDYLNIPSHKPGDLSDL
jgi:hypothetical protein